MTTPDLAELQQVFSRWLHGPETAPPPRLLACLAGAPGSAAERLAVYRRSSRHAQRCALDAAFPVLAALVGPDLFAAFCHDHLRDPGSRSGDLHRFGEAMALTVRAEPACAGLPYLADVAELEWAVHRSQFLGDEGGAPCVDPRSVAADQLHRLCVVVPQDLLLLALPTPAGRIWRAHQPGAEERLEAIDPLAGPEWLAVRRVGAGVCLDALAEAEYDLLADSRAGLTLAQCLDRQAEREAAAQAAAGGRQAVPPPPDLDVWLPRWLALGLARGLALAPG